MYNLIGLFAFIAVCAAQKLPVTIYYESLCPDSQMFITQQVYPQFKNGLKDYIDIKWIPYGKSTFVTRGSDVEFQCHHGQNECYGNRVQSCAIEHIQVDSYQTEHSRESLIAEYINCLMSAGNNFPDETYPGERCARDNKVKNWDVISACANFNSTEGSQILKKNGELTNEFQNPLKSVPTVTFNFKNEPEDQALAMTNFRSVACKYISSPKPVLCARDNSAGSLFVAPLTIMAAFVISRMF